MTEKEQTAREAELARREAALAAREAQLEQEQAKLEAARAEAPKGRKTFLNNNDPDFVNPKEKLYDKFPLTVHQMDIIIGVLFALIVLFLVLGFTHTSFSGCSAAKPPQLPPCSRQQKTRASAQGQEALVLFLGMVPGSEQVLTAGRTSG